MTPSLHPLFSLFPEEWEERREKKKAKRKKKKKKGDNPPAEVHHTGMENAVSQPSVSPLRERKNRFYPRPSLPTEKKKKKILCADGKVPVKVARWSVFIYACVVVCMHLQECFEKARWPGTIRHFCRTLRNGSLSDAEQNNSVAAVTAVLMDGLRLLVCTHLFLFIYLLIFF